MPLAVAEAWLRYWDLRPDFITPDIFIRVYGKRLPAPGTARILMGSGLYPTDPISGDTIGVFVYLDAGDKVLASIVDEGSFIE